MKKIDKVLLGGVLLSAGVMLLTLLPGLSAPSSIDQPVVNTHYRTVSDHPIVRDKVVMLFWYGCPHCRKTHEAMEASQFRGSLRKRGYELRMIPVAGNPRWERDARLYYALSLAGISDSGHALAMRLIQDLNPRENEDLLMVIDQILQAERQTNPGYITTADLILRSMSSATVSHKLEEDAYIVKQIGIRGVPGVLINGQNLIELNNQIRYIDVPVIALKLLDQEAAQ